MATEKAHGLSAVNQERKNSSKTAAVKFRATVLLPG
jgi:hypothetical protein